MSSEFEGNLTASRRRLWLAALVIVVLGAGVITALALRASERAATTDASRRPAPPPAGAFAAGGRPGPAPAALHHAFAEVLPDWVIALDRMGTAARDNDTRGYDDAERQLREARAELAAPELLDALGPDGARRIDAVLTRAHAAAAATTEKDIERATDRFLESVGVFNDGLAAAGRGFFLDGDVILGPNSRRIVLLYVFTVEHVRLYDAEGRRIRALQLRRLDRLNWSHRLLGFTSPHLREALVLLDQVDELLVGYVLPALAPGAEVTLLDHDSIDADSPWQRRVHARAGQVIRDEYAATHGVDAVAAARLGEHLAARRQLIERWNDRLQPRGVALRGPSSLQLEDLDELRHSLAGAVPDEELDRLAQLERALAEPAAAQVFAAAREVLIASIERHEVQHRVDAAAAAPRPVPAELEAYVGPRLDLRGKPRRLVTLARDELSAYLSSLARDDRTTRLQLTLISRFLFDRERWSSAECYAALVIFEGLAAELGVEHAPLVADGSVARDAIAGVYLELTARPEAEVRDAARQRWERLFGAPLPEIRLAQPRPGQ